MSFLKILSGCGRIKGGQIASPVVRSCLHICVCAFAGFSVSIYSTYSAASEPILADVEHESARYQQAAGNAPSPINPVSEPDRIPAQPVSNFGAMGSAEPVFTEFQTLKIENESSDMAVSSGGEAAQAVEIGEADDRNQCALPFANSYRKSIAFTSFMRSSPASSSAGSLYKVDQYLPLLLSENLTSRHSTLSPVHLPGGFHKASYESDARSAAQAQLLARKHRTQFIVSGEVTDMSMVYPTKAQGGALNRFMNGASNFLSINPLRDTRSRIFSFHLQLRDGFTGQVVFNQTYETHGKWTAKESPDIGFGSPRFWQTDYGKKIKLLVAKASDEIAATVHCNPYIARVDVQPGREHVIIRSGASSGLRAGDTLELYQLIVQPVTGEYDTYDTRLVKRNTAIYLTEVYPSHSVANVSQDVFLSGQYLAMAR